MGWEVKMEEHAARNGHPFGQHRPYPEEHKQAILRAYASWKGSTEAFCAQHGVFKGTLWAWRRPF